MGKAVVRLAEGKDHRPFVGGGHPQGGNIHLPRQDGGGVLQGRELGGVGGAGLGQEHPLEGVDKILGGDGVFGGLALGGSVGQPVPEGEGVPQPVGRDAPALAQIVLELAVGAQPEQPAVEVFAGDDVGGGRGHLGVEVRGDLLHKPGEAVGGVAAAGQPQHQGGGQRQGQPAGESM